MKNLIKSVFLVLLSAIVLAEPSFATTTMVNDEILDLFDQNGIYYYKPNGSLDACNSGSTTLEGKDTPEKMWNFFIQNGFTDAQAAGILGNAFAETGMEPTRASNSTFWGMFQWSQGRKAKLFAKLEAAGLMQYTSPEYWPAGASKNIPEADFDKILQIELEHTLSENDGHWQEEIKKQNTPEAAAEVFLTLFERAVNGETPILYYQPFLGLMYQGAQRRRDFAKEYFEKYSGKGTVSSGASNTAENGKNISFIGDSLIVGATDELLKQFEELSKEDINARVSRPWSEGIEIAQNAPLKNVVVFALGSNSPNLTREELERAFVAIGVEKRIILVTNFNADNEHYYDSNNELFKEYAKNNSNVIVADWAEAIKGHKDEYMADYVHPNQAGYELFVKTIFEAINNNIDSNGCSVNGEFTSLVKAYAWPEYHRAPFTDRMPAYAEAVTRSISEGRYVGGSINGVPGIDCGGFVTVITQNSGLEPEYNNTRGATGTQEKWVKDHNWALLNGSESTLIDTSVLQAGDVAFADGHTFIYVGEIPGFDSIIASASYGQSSARSPMAGREDLLRGGEGSPVRWYRNPKVSSGVGTSLKSNLQTMVWNKE